MRNCMNLIGPVRPAGVRGRSGVWQSESERFRLLIDDDNNDDDVQACIVNKEYASSMSEMSSTKL